MSVNFYDHNITTSGNVIANSGNFTTLTINNINVSISGHSHVSTDITNFNSGVSGLVSGIYAPLSGKLNQFANTSSSELSSIITDETGTGLLVFNSSPTLTGIPLVPTATSGTNTNQIASTAFVRTEVSNLVASAPSTLDTLNELASALGNDANFSTTITNNLAGKANLSGASFTGSISAPTGNFTSLLFNGSGVSISGHTHVSSDISNFNSSVSGLLPVKNIIAGTGVSITSSSGIYTINSSSSISIDAGEYPLISISSQPSGISVGESSTATFSVTATASYPSGTISYQWQNSSDNTNWSNIIFANSSTLTLTSVTLSDNGKYYRCNLQSLLSNINSNSAQLTVLSDFVATSVILSSNSNYTVPNGAKVVKIWSIGAGGSSTYACDGGGGANGNPGVVSYRHGFITNTSVVVSGSIGQPVASVCNLYTQGGSSTLSNLSTVINPSISSLVGGGGGIEFGTLADGPSSGGLSTYTLWSNYSTRRDYLGINAVINAAGGNSSTHIYGRGSNGGNGFAGAIVMQFLPATNLVIPFFSGSGTFTVPIGYSSVKIWVVGEGGIGYIYCDGGPSTTGGNGGISYKTWSVSGGETISYSVGRVLTGGRNWCSNPANGASSTATLNGVTITGTGGQGSGSNGTGTGGDGSGIAGNDVSSINAAYLSYSPSLINYGFPGYDFGTAFGGIVLVQCIV